MLRFIQVSSFWALRSETRFIFRVICGMQKRLLSGCGLWVIVFCRKVNISLIIKMVNDYSCSSFLFLKASSLIHNQQCRSYFVHSTGSASHCYQLIYEIIFCAPSTTTSCLLSFVFINIPTLMMSINVRSKIIIRRNVYAYSE